MHRTHRLGSASKLSTAVPSTTTVSDFKTYTALAFVVGCLKKISFGRSPGIFFPSSYTRIYGPPRIGRSLAFLPISISSNPITQSARLNYRWRQTAVAKACPKSISAQAVTLTRKKDPGLLRGQGLTDKLYADAPWGSRLPRTARRLPARAAGLPADRHSRRPRQNRILETERYKAG